MTRKLTKVYHNPSPHCYQIGQKPEQKLKEHTKYNFPKANIGFCVFLLTAFLVSLKLLKGEKHFDLLLSHA